MSTAFLSTAVYTRCVATASKYGYVLESVSQLNAMVLQATRNRPNPPVQPKVVEQSLLLVNTIITICSKERN